MSDRPSSPPYFEILFARLAAGDPLTVAAFGRHVHWGYWPEPERATGTADDYGQAAETLCRKVYERAEIRAGQRLLDVGCGFGGTIASLNEHYTDLAMVGVNIDARQLERAAHMVLPKNGNRAEWVAADAAMLPFADDSFDVVLAVECIFHFNRRAFLHEAARVLKPGGNLTLSDFVPEERAVPFLESSNLGSDAAIRWSYGQIDLCCSVERYRALVAGTGLRLAEEVDITAHTLPTYDFLRHSTDGWDDLHAAEMFARSTRQLEKASRKGFLRYKILRFEK